MRRGRGDRQPFSKRGWPQVYRQRDAEKSNPPPEYVRGGFLGKERISPNIWEKDRRWLNREEQRTQRGKFPAPPQQPTPLIKRLVGEGGGGTRIAEKGDRGKKPAVKVRGSGVYSTRAIVKPSWVLKKLTHTTGDRKLNKATPQKEEG